MIKICSIIIFKKKFSNIFKKTDSQIFEYVIQINFVAKQSVLFGSYKYDNICVVKFISLVTLHHIFNGTRREDSFFSQV